jgi:hypothetical protein
MAFLASLFGKKDGRRNNGANLTPEIQKKAVEESAEVRAIKSQTKKMMELAKYHTAAQKVQEIVNPATDDDDLTKFMKMIELAVGSTPLSANPTQTNSYGIPVENPQPTLSSSQTTLTEEPEETIPDNWQKFYDKVSVMNPQKFEKMMAMLERFS